MELMDIMQYLLDLMNPEKLIRIGGLLVIVIIVFAENGIPFGVFLPGDSLLFSAGLLCAVGVLNVNIVILVLSIAGAGIVGNFVGYYLGNATGKVFMIKTRDDSIFFKKKYLDMAQSFYNKYGGKAIILGRFLPIIRTFVPFIAGTIQFDYKKYILFNISGALIWASTMVLSGYYLGIYVPEIKEHLEYIVLVIVIITIIPTIVTYYKERNKLKKEKSIQ